MTKIFFKDDAMRTLRAALAVLTLMSSMPLAHARAGRTTADDCKAGSDDPDCPDAAPAPGKPGQPPPHAWISPGAGLEALTGERKAFFFEKKKQKTFDS